MFSLDGNRDVAVGLGGGSIGNCDYHIWVYYGDADRGRGMEECRFLLQVRRSIHLLLKKSANTPPPPPAGGGHARSLMSEVAVVVN